MPRRARHYPSTHGEQAEVQSHHHNRDRHGNRAGGTDAQVEATADDDADGHRGSEQHRLCGHRPGFLKQDGAAADRQGGHQGERAVLVLPGQCSRAVSDGQLQHDERVEVAVDVLGGPAVAQPAAAGWRVPRAWFKLAAATAGLA
jgi:hypothetical protein